MKRIVAIASLGALATVSSAAHATAVTVESFDNWLPDSVYGSWPDGTLVQNPTNFGVQATKFGGGYANIGAPFIIDGTGTNTVQLMATVNAGVAGFIIALGDTTGHEWNYAWYGNIPGGGTGGSNDYTFTKAISAFNYSTGAAGQLDIANIDYIHVQVDPGFNPNTLYDVTYNDLSLVSGAASLTWNNAGGTGDGTTWDVGVSQNFSNGAGPATFAQGDNVTFNAANAGHSNVTINSAVNPGSTTVDGSAAYVFSGTGGIGGAGGLTLSNGASLTLNTAANTYTGATTVNTGSTLNVNGSLPSATALAASGNVVFGANAGAGVLVRTVGSIALSSGGKVSVATPTASSARTLLVTGALTFGGTTASPQGQFDLGANDLLIHGGDVAALRSELRAGLIGTAGLTSSAAAASSTLKTALGYAAITAAGTFDGQAVASGDLVVKYTLLGDANLDSAVNFSDLLALAKNYGGSNTTWSGGDFNYDATTDFTDLLGLAKNYSRTLSAADATTVGPAFAADYALAVSLAPEPGLLSVLGLGALKLASRRRR